MQCARGHLKITQSAGGASATRPRVPLATSVPGHPTGSCPICHLPRATGPSWHISSLQGSWRLFLARCKALLLQLLLLRFPLSSFACLGLSGYQPSPWVCGSVQGCLIRSLSVSHLWLVFLTSNRLSSVQVLFSQRPRCINCQEIIFLWSVFLLPSRHAAAEGQFPSWEGGGGSLCN